MPMYSFKALGADGSVHRGEIDAVDAQLAAARLQARGLLLLNLKPGANGSVLGRSRRVFKGAALVSFTQQLATLLGAGQPLERALGSLLRQAKEPRVQALVQRVREEVKGGKPLSQALEEESGQFSTLYLGLVRAGEAGGTLDTTLAQLGQYLERSQTLRAEVVNALIYPAFLVFGVLGALGLLLAYVVPQFVPIFRDLGVPIPWITQAILALGTFMSQYGLAMLAVALLTPWGLVMSRRQPALRERQDRRLLRARGLGPLLSKLEAARLARTLGTLLDNGVALLPALLIVRQLSTNHAMRAQVGEVTERVKGGQRLAAAFEHEPLLPELALQMIAVGEESGQLAAMLLKAAEVFDVEVKRGIDRLLAALVPSLTVVMAALVAVIMLAVMLPLMSLTSHI